MSGDFPLAESHGIYVHFNYGVEYSFMATRGTDEPRWHLSRVTVTEHAAMQLSLVAICFSLEECRKAVQEELERILPERAAGYRRRALYRQSREMEKAESNAG